MQKCDHHTHIDLSEVDSVVTSIIHSFINRSHIGKEKYGKTLDRTDLKVNDWINHAQEELMDGILYLEKLKQTCGTFLLNHTPSLQDTPIHAPSIQDTIHAPSHVDDDFEFFVFNMNNSETVCSDDSACDMDKKNNVEFHISVLSGEQCNNEVKVIKNSSVAESKFQFNKLIDNAVKLNVTALILYAVNTSTNDSKEILSWFYDEIIVEKDYNKEKI